MEEVEFRMFIDSIGWIQENPWWSLLISVGIYYLVLAGIEFFKPDDKTPIF